jgi:hypothetical protein
VSAPDADDLVPGFEPETELERRLLRDGELRAGLAWGAARPGHPEGRIGLHVADIMEDIGRQDPRRADLRVIALVHDSFKRVVDPDGPRTKHNDHAWVARRFAQRYVDDPRVLEAIELHDEPYRRWRDGAREASALDDLVARIPDLDLFIAFVELDATTEGKDFSFLFWLRYELATRGLLPPAPPQDTARMHAGGTPTAYVQVLETDPEDQQAIAEAIAAETSGRDDLPGSVEVLRSGDGMRVALLVRWEGESGPHLLAARSLIRRALARHPVLLRARPQEAHAYTTVSTS